MIDENPSILIVDDDKFTRKLLIRHLGDYTVFCGEDGNDGWEMFLRHKPDVVMTDLRMPELGGVALMKKIKAHSPQTPVIILSGAGTMDDVIEALRAGAIDYIEKISLGKDLVTHVVNKAYESIRLESIAKKDQENLEIEVASKTSALRKELEARIAAEAEMEEAKKAWERTFDAIPDMIAVVDTDYRILKANKAMVEKLGVRCGSEGGCACYEVAHNSDKPPEYCPHAKMLKDGKIHVAELYEEGLGGNIEITVVPYYDEKGSTLQGSIQIIRDINDRKKIEEEKKRMQTQLLHAQKLESVGQLAAGIAHEINTPIQFVSSNTDFINESFESLRTLIETYDKLFLAAQNGEVLEKLFEEVEDAKEEGDWEYLAEELPIAFEQSKEGLHRVASIVRAMKEFSHPGSKEKEFKNLNDIIKTTGIVARNEWKYVAELELNLTDDLPPVQCFSDDIGQVLLNIIINAAHAIEDKIGENPTSDKGKITVTTDVADDYAIIKISDTGVGMKKEVINKVFDPFFTTKKVGRGTGQGLTIAWNIITEKHEGELSIDSNVGEGTTFTIKLPVSNE